MATTLPAPIEFRLPDEWLPAPPDEVGAPDAAFVALHPSPDQGFTANITIDGEFRPDNAPLTEFADDSIRRLREATEAVSLANRSEVGSVDAPGLTQVLKVTADVNGTSRDLVQSQVYLSLLDTDDPRRRAVIRLVLTASAAQYHAVLGDFQWFVSTVRPESTAD